MYGENIHIFSHNRVYPLTFRRSYNALNKSLCVGETLKFAQCPCNFLPNNEPCFIDGGNLGRKKEKKVWTDGGKGKGE